MYFTWRFRFACKSLISTWSHLDKLRELRVIFIQLLTLGYNQGLIFLFCHKVQLRYLLLWLSSSGNASCEQRNTFHMQRTILHLIIAKPANASFFPGCVGGGCWSFILGKTAKCTPEMALIRRGFAKPELRRVKRLWITLVFVGGAITAHLRVTPQFAAAPVLDINSARYLHIFACIHLKLSLDSL